MTGTITAPHLGAIERYAAEARGEILIASDIDFTLAGEFKVDPQTGERVPVITSELVGAASGLHLVPVTGRRAETAAVREMWLSGLVPQDRLVVAENGGVIVSSDGGALDLVGPAALAELEEIEAAVSEPGILEIPPDRELAIKAGRTLLVVALRRQDGRKVRGINHSMAEQLRAIVPGERWQVVDGNTTLTVQPGGVNKSFGLTRYRQYAGVGDGHGEIQMGDGPNDREMLARPGLAIGFSEEVSDIVDVMIPNGAVGAPAVLRAIKRGLRP